MILVSQGSATTAAIKASGQSWRAIYFYGTWNTATVTLQQSANGTVWHTCRSNLATPANVAANTNAFHSIHTSANYFRVLFATVGTDKVTVEAL